MPRSWSHKTRIGLVGGAALFALLAGAAVLGAHFFIFFSRASFPLDLEWMEGGMLLHAARLGAGKTVYPPPSLEFVPYLYTPLYPAVLAVLAKVFPLGYLLGRTVSILAFAGSLGAMILAAGREAPAPDTAGAALAVALGLGGAGAVAAAYVFTGTFYDIVRADSLLLLLSAWALVLALVGRGLGSALLAGVLIALAFFTKQTASLLGIGLGMGLLFANWRRGLAYGLAAAVTLGAGLGWLALRSDGWFWTYVFELHQSHGFSARLAFVDTPLRLLRFLAPVLLALFVSLGGLLLGRDLRRTDAIHLLLALAGFFASCVGFGTRWAFDNAFIPAVFFPTFSAVVLSARLGTRGFLQPKAGAAAFVAVAGIALGLGALRPGFPDTGKWVPGPSDRAAAERFLAHLRSLPGRLFIPFHPYYAVLAGQPPHLHRMGVLDVAAALGRPQGLDQAIAEQRFSHVVLDWKSQPWEWPGLEERYHDVHRFTDGVDAVRAFSGAETSPRRLLARTVPPPELPPGGRRLYDFETGYGGFAPEGDAGFTPEGEAFAGGPAPSQEGLFGRRAADSRAAGLEKTGRLSSTPFLLDRPHLSFVLAGKPDPNLRVVLLVANEVARSASPREKPERFTWDVSDFLGQPATLVVQDDSEKAGLAIDDITVF